MGVDPIVFNSHARNRRVRVESSPDKVVNKRLFLLKYRVHKRVVKVARKPTERGLKRRLRGGNLANAANIKVRRNSNALLHGT